LARLSQAKVRQKLFQHVPHVFDDGALRRVVVGIILIA